MTARKIGGALIGLALLLMPAGVGAQQSPGDLTAYLPSNAEIAGWKPAEAPQNYRGEELFRMINGGADVFHEYGFKQTLAADYLDTAGKAIKLEIYEMESPAAAYGIYTFRVGPEGKAAAIGQEALLEDYYLNFWKGNFLVTVVGPDPEEKTVQSITALAEAVAARIPKTGPRPELAELLLGEPLAFSRPKYIRGPLGLMSSYVFDTKNIFRVGEGLIGTVEGCRAFVFRYADQDRSTEIYRQAMDSFKAGTRFTDQVLSGERYSMKDRDKNFILVNRTGRYLTIVIGPDKEMVESIAEPLAEKLGNR